MLNQRTNRPIEILLIEDNPGDVRLTKEALRTSKVPHRIRVAEDGIEASAILFQQGQHADAPRPDLIVLDLNLPRKDGRAVLAEVKADPRLKRVPIVILTTSQSEPDILQAYDTHANSYITKPMDYEKFQAAIKAIESFWLSVVRLPLAKDEGRGIRSHMWPGEIGAL
jgi:CheY-like chemotaxis protein